jgi:hypothetical protein
MLTAEAVEKKIVEYLAGPGVFQIKELREALGIKADDPDVRKLNKVFQLKTKGLLKTNGEFDRHRRYSLAESKLAVKWLETMKRQFGARVPEPRLPSGVAALGVGRLSGVEGRIGQVEERLSRIEGQLDGITQILGELQKAWS